MRDIISRISMGVAATMLGQVVGIGGNLFVVALCLRYWGAQAYGEWVTLSAVVSYLSLLDLGIQTYATNRICQAYARDRLGEAHRDLHSALRLAYGLPGGIFVILVVIVWFIPIHRVLNLQETGRMSATITLLFLGGNTLLLSIPQGVIGGIYRATGAYARGSMVGNIFRLVQLMTSMLVLFLAGSLVHLSVAWFVVNMASGAFMFWDLRRFRPTITVGIRLGSLRHIMRLITPGLLFLVMNTAGALNMQGTLLILNRFLGGSAVAQFSTLRALANLVAQVGIMVGSASWPEFTALDAKNEKENLRRFWRSFVKVNFFLATLAALLLRIVGQDFYRVWTGRQLSFDGTLLDILLIQGILMSFWNSSGIPLLASNRHQAYAWWTLINALMTVLLSLLAVQMWGVMGVAVASLLADVLCNLVVVPWLTCRFLDESLSFFSRSIFLPGCAIGLGVFAVSEWIEPMLSSPVSRLVLLPLLVLGLYLVPSYLLWMDQAERRLLRGWCIKLQSLVAWAP